MNVSVAVAKAKFSELIKRAESGEEIDVTRRGKVVARMVPAAQAREKLPLLGALKGKIWIADDFDEPLEEFRAYIK